MTTGTGEPRERANAAGNEYVEAPGGIPADTFAARLVLVRHYCGRLSIEQAATGAGINPEAWRRWEDGARPRDRIEASQAISDHYNIDLNWLMFGGPLLPARGKPTKRLDTDSCGYRGRSATAAIGTTRPGGSRPKGRTDPLRPISPSVPGRRANRVGPGPMVDARHAA